MFRRTLLALVLVAAIATGAAQAETVTRQDAQGRTITFDVLTAGVDVDWYAALLTNAAHGDEISNVLVRVVAPSEIRRLCGANAAACYQYGGRQALIVLPAGKSASLAETVLHEYAHHLDATWAVGGIRELNGTPVWWSARGVQALLDAGTVAFDYSLGWNRSIGEIFAEDYAYIHLGGSYAIPWLAPPDDALRNALLTELGGATATPPPAPQPPATGTGSGRPVTVTRSGRLRPGAETSVPFRLLGPGRRVTVTVGVTDAARVEVACGGAVVSAATVTRGRTATLSAPGLGPAACEARVVSTSTRRQAFALRLRLALDATSPRRR